MDPLQIPGLKGAIHSCSRRDSIRDGMQQSNITMASSDGDWIASIAIGMAGEFERGSRRIDLDSSSMNLYSCRSRGQVRKRVNQATRRLLCENGYREWRRNSNNPKLLRREMKRFT